MSAVYIESSALLAWLEQEARQREVADIINSAEHVCTSRLTFLECQRVLIRAETQKLLSAADRRKSLGWLSVYEREWDVLEITQEVYRYAQEKFPVEPVRTLDAIHLASALTFLSLYENLKVLSFDTRIIDNLEPLGLIQVRSL